MKEMLIPQRKGGCEIIVVDDTNDDNTPDEKKMNKWLKKIKCLIKLKTTMKKIVILFLCLAFTLGAYAQEKKIVNSDKPGSGSIQNKPDTAAKARALFTLTNIYKEYAAICFADSAIVNCYILLSSDGKTAKYDTICGANLNLFDAAGVAPVTLKVKGSYWVHKPATNDGFIEWLKKKEK